MEGDVDEVFLEQCKQRLFAQIDRDFNLRQLASRRHRLENFRLEDGRLRFDLERHPSASTSPWPETARNAYLVVVQTWAFDIKRRTVEFEREEAVDLVVNRLDEIVREDARNVVDGLWTNFEDRPETDDEEEIAAWAGREAEEIARTLPGDLEPAVELGGEMAERWKSYVEEYVELWKEHFVDEAVEYWHRYR